MQGQLRSESLSTAIRTECGHCAQPLDIKIDSELGYEVDQTGASPFVFVPLVDFDKLTDPSIIDAF